MVSSRSRYETLVTNTKFFTAISLANTGDFADVIGVDGTESPRAAHYPLGNR